MRTPSFTVISAKAPQQPPIHSYALARLSTCCSLCHPSAGCSLSPYLLFPLRSWLHRPAHAPTPGQPTTTRASPAGGPTACGLCLPHSLLAYNCSSRVHGQTQIQFFLHAAHLKERGRSSAMHPITPSAASCTQRFAREMTAKSHYAYMLIWVRGVAVAGQWTWVQLARVVTVQHAASSLSSSSLSLAVLQLP